MAEGADVTTVEKTVDSGRERSEGREIFAPAFGASGGNCLRRGNAPENQRLRTVRNRLSEDQMFSAVHGKFLCARVRRSRGLA